MARSGIWVRMRKTMRSRLISGLLVMVPLAITLYVLRVLFAFTSQILSPPLRNAVYEWRGSHPWPWLKWLEDNAFLDYVLIGGLSILLLLGLIYLVGVIAAHVFGRRIIEFFEKLLLRVPIVKSVYSAAKGIVQAFSLPNSSTFKSVVMIQMFQPGQWCVGFMVGPIQVNGDMMCRIFIPTVPNITTGFYVIARPDQVYECNVSVEDAFKSLVSAGIISTEKMTLTPMNPRRLKTLEAGAATGLPTSAEKTAADLEGKR